MLNHEAIEGEDIWVRLGRDGHGGSSTMVQCCAVTKVGCRVSGDGSSVVRGGLYSEP